MSESDSTSFVSDFQSVSGLYHAGVWKLHGSWGARETFLPAWELGKEAEFQLVDRLYNEASAAADRTRVVVTVTRSEARYLLHLLRWFFDIDDRGDECDAITGASEGELKALIVKLEQALTIPSTRP